MKSIIQVGTIVLLLSVITGCADRFDEADASKTAAPLAAAGRDNKEEQATAPVPFDEIPLANDTSNDAPPIPPGTEAGEVREFTALKIPFCWCPAGTFEMGSAEDAPGHHLNETQFEVTLSRGFWMQQTEVTQEQYQALMGVNPSFFKGESNPVESVSWDDAQEFCRRLGALPPEQEAGNIYRLPTEAEWEYACRAGAETVFSFGDSEGDVTDYGWVNTNSDRTTHPVASKQPNAWHLYDLHGNVTEWCSDWYGEYPATPVTDPHGPDEGDKRCLRGGGWFFIPEHARCSHRDAYAPTAVYVGLGFRLVAEVTTGE